MRKDKILITGANGQIGSVLTHGLRMLHGNNYVITSDIQIKDSQNGPFEELNILDSNKLEAIIDRHEITQIYHLVAILSASGEKDPLRTWQINMDGLFNVLQVGVKKNLDKIFFPSSIAVFGPTTPSHLTPQHTVLEPTTVYGISKSAAELWCQYFWQRYQLDIRSVRFPGIIGYQSMPGGGTTDYAVDIFHHAAQFKDYTCFLHEDTRLPMLYMTDAIQSVFKIMDAPASQIKQRTSYNLSGMDFTPLELATEIQKYIPNFKVHYLPDERQAIADSWPDSIDDRHAREDWGWQPKYNLSSMTVDMLKHLSQIYPSKDLVKS